MANPYKFAVPTGMEDEDAQNLPAAPSLSQRNLNFAPPTDVGAGGFAAPTAPTQGRNLNFAPPVAGGPAPAMAQPGVAESATPASNVLVETDISTEPEFIELMELRRQSELMRGDPAMMAQAQQQHARLMESLTTRHDLTEVEVADMLYANSKSTPEPVDNSAAEVGGHMARQAFGTAMELTADTLEPLSYPQDVGGTMARAAIEIQERDPKASIGKKLGHVLGAIKNDVQHGRYFDSLNPAKYFSGTSEVAERDYSGEGNLRGLARLNGNEDEIPDAAFVVGGVLADVLVDPAMMGLAFRSIGRIDDAARGIKALQGRAAPKGVGTKLAKFGDEVERALSPVGVGSALPKSVKDAIGYRFDSAFERILNTELKTGWVLGEGKGVRLARMLTSTGSTPFNEGRDFLTGAPNKQDFIDYAAATGQEASKVDERELRQWMAERAAGDTDEVVRPVVPGTATPAAMSDSMQRAEYIADKGLGALKNGLARVYAAFGNERGKAYVQGLGDNLTNIRRIMDRSDLKAYDTEMTDSLMNLAMDTVKNVGIANRPGAMKQLDNFSQRNLSARTLFQGRSSPSPYLDTLGEELRSAIQDAPTSSSLVDRENRKRIKELAAKKKIDPEVALKTYDEVVDTVIANDVMLGYHNSMYAPIKDSFYEEVARRGGTFDQADDIWQSMVSAGLRGEDAAEIGLDANLRVITPYGPKGPKETNIGDVLDDTLDDVDDEFLEEAAEEAAEAQEVAMKTGALFSRLENGLSLNFNEYFKGMSQGHLRNTYAAFQSKRDPERLIKQLQQGEVIRTPVLSKGVYETSLRERGYDHEADLIKQYVESVAPGRRGERGLLVRSSSLASHLVDSGVDKGRANEVMREVMAAVGPANMGELTGGTWVTANYLRRVENTLDTSFGMAAEKTQPATRVPYKIKTIENPEGVPRDFPVALMPEGTRGDPLKFIALENERVSQITNRLRQLAGTQDNLNNLENQLPLNAPTARDFIVPRQGVRRTDLTGAAPAGSFVPRQAPPVPGSATGRNPNILEGPQYTQPVNPRRFVQTPPIRVADSATPGFTQNRVVDTSNAAAGTPTGWTRGEGVVGPRRTVPDAPLTPRANTPIPNTPEDWFRGADTVAPRYNTPVAGQPSAPFVTPTSRVDPTRPTLEGDLDEIASLTEELNGIRNIREIRNKTYDQAEKSRVGQAWDADMDLYEMHRSMLGQIYDPMTSLGENAEYLKRHYPARQFVLDSYTMARRGGYVKELSEDGHPVGWQRVENRPEWGPFNNTIIHKHLYHELDNALRSDAEGKMSMLGRVASAVTGGYIAGPMSTVNNFIGGVYSSALYGTNPVDLINEWDSTVRILKQGGKEREEMLDDIGHLLGARSKAVAFAEALETNKLDLSGFKQDKWDQGKDMLKRGFQTAMEKPLGQKWLGLDWFQATEDTLKMANYRVALRKFNGDKAKAVEFTRNVLFDYAQLPEAARILRDKGVMTFPGFPLFMTSRTLNTVMKAPGRLAPWDRAAGGAVDLQTDEDTQIALASQLKPWNLENGAIPFRIRQGDGGEILSMMSLNAMIPKNILDLSVLGKPVDENLMTLGVLRTGLDVTSAIVSGTGKPAYSEKYGGRVFDPGAPFAKRALQTAVFTAQGYMPQLPRKLFNYNPARVDPNDLQAMESPWSGVGVSALRAVQRPVADAMRGVLDTSDLEEDMPEIARWINDHAFPLDQEQIDNGRRIRDEMRKKTERPLFDQVASLFLPGVTTTSLEPRMMHHENNRKKVGYEADRQKITFELEKQLQYEYNRPLNGQPIDEARVAQLQQMIAQAGMEEITLPDGRVVPVSPAILNEIAMGRYLNSYQNRGR